MLDKRNMMSLLISAKHALAGMSVIAFTGTLPHSRPVTKTNASLDQSN